MKTFLGLASLATLFATTLCAQVWPSATILTNGTAFDGGGVTAPDTVTLVLDGLADAGVSRTENTIWQPDGSPVVLGDLGLGAHDFTPQGGAGLYWLQYRLVDANENYQDQWISFTVQPGYIRTNASATYADGTVTLAQDGQASNGFGWTENVIWRPDGTPDVLGLLPLGQIQYAPVAGSGTYWYQFRFVDGVGNFHDQWTSFVVP